MPRVTTSLELPHGTLHYPVFMPDATQGVVRSLDASDIARCAVQAVVMNTFHLMQRPGSLTVQALGGLHRMSGWRNPIVTDSGGFQAYSLIRQNSKHGSLTESGIIFRPEGSERKLQLTPEKTVQLQLGYGADIVICLDDCTHADDPPDEQLISVRRTVKWARRCKDEFIRLLEQRKASSAQQPLLFAVIQGGGSTELRRHCAEELLEIGFDGFGFGGWPLDSQGQLLTEIIGYTRDLIPARFPMHALGIGGPQNVVACARMGYEIFDSSMPTRDARHGRLYMFSAPHGLDEHSTSYLYIADEKHVKANSPISPFCDCLCCTSYSLGYLHHLFKINDSLFLRLATMHNLRFMTQLTERLRAELWHEH